MVAERAPTVRLWRDVPWRERVTERDIMLTWDKDGLRARMQTPGCHAAVWFNLGSATPRRYAPCASRPLLGTDFCRKHGGEPVQDLPHIDFDGLSLTARAAHALTRAGLHTRHAVAATPDDQLRALRNFGAVSLAEVRRLIPYDPDAAPCPLPRSGIRDYVPGRCEQ